MANKTCMGPWLETICNTTETIRVHCARNSPTATTQVNLGTNITGLVFTFFDFLLLAYLAIQTTRSLRMLSAARVRPSR